MTKRDRAVGVTLPRDVQTHDIEAFAQRAEAHGFDELWVVEDLGHRGALTQAATVLAATSRIRVGIGVLPAGARNVAFTAMEIANLAHLHPDRVDIAIGHGMPTWMRSVGAWPQSPLTLLTEYITVLRALLRGGRVHFKGRYIHIDGLQLHSTPVHPPDVLAGVRGPNSLAASGLIADGTLLAEPAMPPYVREAIRLIGPSTPHRVIGYNIASVSHNTSAALSAARSALEMVGEPDWAPHIAPLPFADEFVALRQRCDNPRAFVSTMPDEWIQQLAVAGTPEQAKSQLDKLFDAGLTSAVLTPAGSDHLTALDSLAHLPNA
ncbi:LLM class flavin-dependent oxidoreductase [Streptomyces longwoodensis]|uniref:LLM class flavin-dependent oxidoreductase n=1 Tax=Streptomyces longwoodensis TaxID=68231 RepID=UPI0036FD2476